MKNRYEVHEGPDEITLAAIAILEDCRNKITKDLNVCEWADKSPGPYQRETLLMWRRVRSWLGKVQSILHGKGMKNS